MITVHSAVDRRQRRWLRAERCAEKSLSSLAFLLSFSAHQHPSLSVVASQRHYSSPKMMTPMRYVVLVLVIIVSPPCTCLQRPVAVLTETRRSVCTSSSPSPMKNMVAQPLCRTSPSSSQAPRVTRHTKMVFQKTAMFPLQPPSSPARPTQLSSSLHATEILMGLWSA